MSRINDRKRDLLEKFAKLNFILTSYVILGSKSVEHGSVLFNFENLNMASYFTNFGPYIYERPINHLRKDNVLLADMAYTEGDTMYSSSAQVMGIRTDNPPFISASILQMLNSGKKSFIESYPHTPDRKLNKRLSLDNSAYYSPQTKLAVRTIWSPLSDPKSLFDLTQTDVDNGMKVVVRIPLYSTSEPLDQIEQILGKEHNGIIMIPTGVSVIDNIWSLTYASISSLKHPHYKQSLDIIASTYTGSLHKLAEYAKSCI